MLWVRELAKRRIEIPGVVAVTLGDSLGPMQPASDAFAERGEWVLTEKGIVRGAGLGGRVEGILAAPGDRPFELGRGVIAMRGALGIPPGAQTQTA